MRLGLWVGGSVGRSGRGGLRGWRGGLGGRFIRVEFGRGGTGGEGGKEAKKKGVENEGWGEAKGVYIDDGHHDLRRISFGYWIWIWIYDGSFTAGRGRKRV